MWLRNLYFYLVLPGLYQLYLRKYYLRKCEVSLNSRLKNKIFARQFVATWRIMSGKVAAAKKTCYNNSDEVYTELQKSTGWKENSKKNI